MTLPHHRFLPPSSPVRACIEAARPTTTRFALEDSLSSFATALECDVGEAVDATAAAADEVIDLSSDSSQSDVEGAFNPETQLVLFGPHLPMPHSGRFEEIVDLVSQLAIPPPPLPRSGLGQLVPHEDVDVTRMWAMTSPVQRHLMVSKPWCRGVTVASMQRLNPNSSDTWLNGEMIDACTQLLSRRDDSHTVVREGRLRSYCFSSHFMTALFNTGEYEFKCVKHWTRKRATFFDIFSQRYLFFPVNVNRVHWVLVSVHLPTHTIRSYDSWNDPEHDNHLESVFRYLQDEHMERKGFPLSDRATWTFIPCTADTPQQDNSNDCGVFVCAFIDLLMQDEELRFTPRDIAIYRRRLAFFILSGCARI